MTQRTPALPLVLVLLGVLLLPACGGAPAAQVPLPTMAPAAAADGAPTAPAFINDGPGATAAEVTGESAAGSSSAPAASAPDVVTGSTASEARPPAATAAAPARERPLGQEASLRAGEIDDNARFADYLAYTEGYTAGDVRRADVRERYLITVLDDRQRPVLDARVTVYDGTRPIFRSRTFAGGNTIFMPGLTDAANATEFRIVAEYGQSSAEATLPRDGSERVELGLRQLQPDDTLRLDLLFLLDTTGSMGDELSRIQETIDDIAGRIDAFTPRPSIRYGLVAYKDSGDTYVTYTEAFSPDLATFRERLGALYADGGGDTPEAVEEALYEATTRLDWSDEPAVRLTFLVGDAGPHVPGNTQFTYLDATREALASGVKIYPIAASNTDPQAEYVFRQLAQQTLASFVFLTYQPGASSGAPGESTTLEAGEQPYTVERLDDLIVGIVERELAAAVGAR
ncbi:MAG: hypothetical protein OHK0015_23980 [Chloroflexi bacterium OHK40]